MPSSSSTLVPGLDEAERLTLVAAAVALAEPRRTAPAARVVLCSTGLSRAERLTLEEAVTLLSAAVSYSGDLTSETTHLVAVSRSASSPKIACATSRDLPIVLPTWITHSAAAGELLPLSKVYLLSSASPVTSPIPALTEQLPRRIPLLERDQNSDPALGGAMVTKAGGSDRSKLRTSVLPKDTSSEASRGIAAPLPGHTTSVVNLLQQAYRNGELDDATARGAAAAAEDAHVALWNATYLLDALTDLRRGAGSADEDGHWCFGAPEASRLGDAYSLRSLLLCVGCRMLTHAEYFLVCLQSQPYTPPVLVLDKQRLFNEVGCTHGAAQQGAHAEYPSARMQRQPYTPTLDKPRLLEEVGATHDALAPSCGAVECTAPLCTGTGAISGDEAGLRSQLASLQRLLGQQQHVGH